MLCRSLNPLFILEFIIEKLLWFVESHTTSYSSFPCHLCHLLQLLVVQSNYLPYSMAWDLWHRMFGTFKLQWMCSLHMDFFYCSGLSFIADKGECISWRFVSIV